MPTVKTSTHVESDLHLASYLIACNFTVLRLEGLGRNRVGFIFLEPHTGDCSKAIADFFSGARIEAKTLLAAHRTAKDQLWMFRRLNADEDANAANQFSCHAQ